MIIQQPVAININDLLSPDHRKLQLPHCQMTGSVKM